jgi:hypothetical protein
MNTSSPVIFISHIHEESGLGEVVKEWIEDVFIGSGVTAWLSSDRDDLPSGRKWRDEILGRLHDTKVLVSLISPVSVRRPWVNIELGAAWVKGARVIPLCHSGQTFAALPPPFSDFQGFGLDQDDAAQRLLGGVADGLGAKLPKKIHFEECLLQMRAAQEAAVVLDGVASAAVEAPQHGLPDEQVRLLLVAAELRNKQGDYDIPIDELAGRARVVPAAATYHIRQLHERRFLRQLLYQGGPYYQIGPDGAGWLIEHGLMPGA